MTLFFKKNTMAGHQNGGEKNLGMHACMDANLQAGPSRGDRPMVQLLGGSAKDPLSDRPTAKKMLMKRLEWTRTGSCTDPKSLAQR